MKRISIIMNALLVLVLFLSITSHGQSPIPEKRLEQNELTYQTNIFSNGQKQVSFEVKVTIMQTDSGFVVKEVANMPQGQAIDQTHIRKQDLVVLQRWIQMGPNRFHFIFDQSIKPTNAARFIKLDVPIFADGAGAYETLATLPLKNGYTTSFYNFNVSTQKSDKMIATVTGTENIVTSFGTFPCWKMELKHEVGPGIFQIWVTDDNKRYVVKRRSEFQGYVTESILNKP